MNISTAFLAAKSTSKTWSGVFGYRPETASEATAYGEMFAVMSLSTDVEFPLDRIASLLFDELQASYFGSELKEEVQLSDLEKAMHKLRGKIDMMLEREPELAEKGLDIEMAVALVIDSVLYLAVVGEAKVYISRKQDFAEVADALIDPEAEGFMRTGSLFILPDDRLGLVTSSAGAHNPDNLLQSALSEFTTDDLDETEGVCLLLGYELVKDIEEQVLEEIAAEEQEGITHTEVMDAVGAEADDLPTDSDKEPETIGVEDDTKYGEKGNTDILEVEDDLMIAKPPIVGGNRVSNMARSAVSAGGNTLKNLKQSASKVISHAGESQIVGNMKERLPASGGEVLNKIKGAVFGIFGAIRGIIMQVVELFRTKVLKQAPRRDMYLRNTGDDSKWRYLIVVFVIIALLVVVLVRNESMRVQRESGLQALETSITELLDLKAGYAAQASSLAISEVPDGAAKATLASSIAQLKSDALVLLGAEYITEELTGRINTELVAGADALYDDVLDIQAFTEAEVIADLGANYENTTPTSIAYSSGSLYVTDEAKGNVYSMSTSLDSEVKVLASGLVSPYLIDNDTAGNLVVIHRTETSVVSTIAFDTGAIKRHAGLSVSKIGTLAGIDVWSDNGFLYSINQEKLSILKQASIAGNFQLPNDSAPWMRNEIVAQATDIAVDGNIYILVEGVGIKRYLAGNEAAVSLVGLTPSDTTSMQSADAFENTPAKTYVADSVGKRILIFQNVSQGGELILRFERQIVYRGEGSVFSDIKELVKNPATEELYVLDGSKVIRIQGV